MSAEAADTAIERELAYVYKDELERLRRIETAAKAVVEDSVTWWVQPPIGSGSSGSRLPMEAVHFAPSMEALATALRGVPA